MKDIFLRSRPLRLLLPIILILWKGSVSIAASNTMYINDAYWVGTNQMEQWYDTVELGPNARLYIQNGVQIMFYGPMFKVDPGARIYGVDASGTTITQGTGTGAIVFKHPNPNGTFSGQQVLDGGNGASPAIGASNTFTSIIIDNPGGVKLLNTDTRIGTNLIFNSGYLYCEKQNAILAAGATINGADNSKFVVTAGSGSLCREGVSNAAVVYPVGSSSAATDYLPATITNAGTPDRYNVRAIGMLTPGAANAAADLTRSWQITEANPGGSNVTLALQHNTAFNQGSSYIDSGATIVSASPAAVWRVASSMPFVTTVNAVAGTSIKQLAGITDFTNNTYFTKGIGSGIYVDIKAFLQGAFNGSSMNTTLRSLNLVPATQPYNFPPYNYAGGEVATTLPSNVVDWVLIEMRDSANPATILVRRAALLLQNGHVVDTDGVSPLHYDLNPGSYFVAVRHRNHLAVRTDSAVVFTMANGLPTMPAIHDFTTAQSNAYQNPAITNNAAMTTISNVFCMWACDGTANGSVSKVGLNSDVSFLVNSLGGNLSTVLYPVYHRGDYNMNGRVSYSGLGGDETYLANILAAANVPVLMQHL